MLEANTELSVGVNGYLAGFSTREQYERLLAIIYATGERSVSLTLIPVENKHTSQRGVALCMVSPDTQGNAKLADVAPLGLLMVSEGEDIWNTWSPMNITEKQQKDAIEKTREFSDSLMKDILDGSEPPVPTRESDA